MSTRRFAEWCAATTVCLGLAMQIAGARAGAAAASGAALPRLLSETGLYSDPATATVDSRNRPYSPQYPLWSDGATKHRWVRLPDQSTIDITRIDAWEFPVGTRFWKEFVFGGRRVETRMLVKSGETTWTFASYVWNPSQTDAVLAPAEGVADVAELAPGKFHSIPSIDDCRACHDSSRTDVLGFTALQLSDDRDPLAVHAEPITATHVTLRSLQQEHLLSPSRPELITTPPRIDADSPRARAALGYLSTNCGACHNTDSSLASLGLTFRQPAYGGGLDVVRRSLERRTKWDRPGAPPESTRVIDRETPDLSALVVRMKSRRAISQMPPLGSVVPDHEAVSLMRSWISDEVTRDQK